MVPQWAFAIGIWIFIRMHIIEVNPIAITNVILKAKPKKGENQNGFNIIDLLFFFQIELKKKYTEILSF